MAEVGIQVDEREVRKIVLTLNLTRKTKIEETVRKSERELLREAFRRVESNSARAHAPWFCTYRGRHSCAHHGLTDGGLSPEVIATLLGHGSTHMISAAYGHLIENKEFMRKAAGRVRALASAPRSGEGLSPVPTLPAIAHRAAPTGRSGRPPHTHRGAARRSDRRAIGRTPRS